MLVNHSSCKQIHLISLKIIKNTNNLCFSSVWYRNGNELISLYYFIIINHNNGLITTNYAIKGKQKCGFLQLLNL